MEMIELGKIDELLKDYQTMRNRGESFSEFIRVSKDADTEEYDWNWVDSVGIITKGDFAYDFDVEFLEENFDDMAHDWFKGMEGQVDFGILLECVKEEWKTKEKLFLEKNG